MDAERIAKLETQVESIKEDVRDVKEDVKELHSRITTGNREIMEKIDQMEGRLEEKMNAGAAAAKQQHADIQKEIQEDIQKVASTLDTDIKEVTKRVDVLERWRWMIVGGAIVLGYIIGNLDLIAKLAK